MQFSKYSNLILQEKLISNYSRTEQEGFTNVFFQKRLPGRAKRFPRLLFSPNSQIRSLLTGLVALLPGREYWPCCIRECPQR